MESKWMTYDQYIENQIYMDEMTRLVMKWQTTMDRIPEAEKILARHNIKQKIDGYKREKEASLQREADSLPSEDKR